jgi:tubby-related protein 1
MKRLEDFRKSGRYGSSGNSADDLAPKGVYNYKPSGNVPLVNYCPPNGGNTDLFQCYIVRERTSISSKLYPTYKLYSQEGNKLLILARKMSMNSTSNYHLFDMTRGIPEKTNLSKKSGNYIGKLRGIDSNHSEYVLVTKSEDKHEVAAIQFDRLGLVSQLKEGCQPRKMNILLPRISSDNEPIPHQLKHTDSSKKKPKSLATMLRKNDFGNLFNLVSKDPIYENGNYRLNFHGRVSIPSVKNFQLTSPEDIDDVVCQFGKIADETFNLDFKYPLNPFQAFSLALCHFDA